MFLNFTFLLHMLSFVSIVFLVSSASPLLGAHPLDERYFDRDVIQCKDGSKSFTRDRLNDNYCDCIDGTDEPGTAACPAGKFYCQNVGSTPKFIFSSRINDRICDCCDGSDEYDGSILCPNRCIMGGNVLFKTETRRVSTIHNLDSNASNKSKSRMNLRDLIQKLKGLKLVIIMQLGLIAFLAVLMIVRRRTRSRRRRYR